MAKTDELRRAEAVARERQAHFPRVTGVHYSPELDRLVVDLSSGLGLLVNYREAQGLESATPEDLREVEVSPSGFGLHFPRLDADVYVPALIEGRLGSAAYMAAKLGAEGGRARSTEKTNAARQNGRLGGRPRKAAAG
ncbi:MAG TPA: DUF2442 domain-containing protein [Caulobacteraceae bacterium]